MDILRQALVHMRSGRWNEAHTLVQSDESPPAGFSAIQHLTSEKSRSRIFGKSYKPNPTLAQ